MWVVMRPWECAQADGAAPAPQPQPMWQQVIEERRDAPVKGTTRCRVYAAELEPLDDLDRQEYYAVKFPLSARWPVRVPGMLKECVSTLYLYYILNVLGNTHCICIIYWMYWVIRMRARCSLPAPMTKRREGHMRTGLVHAPASGPA